MTKDKSDFELAKIIWDFSKLNQKVSKADAIIVLGSHDTRVASRGLAEAVPRS